MKTPNPREIMGITGRIEQAKRTGPRAARPAETYRGARRELAKAIYRMNKKGPIDGRS